MPYLIAIERDPKCYKEIQDNWTEVATELNHELMLFNSVEEFNTEFSKPENSNKIIALILICLEELQEELKGDLKTADDLHGVLQSLKERYKCELLLSMFNDPVKPLKNTEQLPVANVIYKPFDVTILKEHTRFALMPGKQVKTQYVHTTQTETIIESLKKFKMLELSEFGMKIDKKFPLELNKSYKFYHPVFSHRKSQHIWARMIHETADHYELFFSQSPTAVLSQMRKRIAAGNKVKNPQWHGLSESNTQKALTVALQTDDQVAQTLRDILNRNFKNLTFIAAADFDPNTPVEADVLITEMKYEEAQLTSQFVKRPLVIRIYDENLTRLELKPRLEVEYLRLEKPVDRVCLVKMFKLFYPHLEIAGEEILQVTAQIGEVTALAEVIKIKEFSEAAMLFGDKYVYPVDAVIEIALPQEDENSLQEVIGKVHFVNERPAPDGLTQQQFVLFGMKDEYLKTMRLWSLQKHIEKNSKNNN